MPGIRIQRDEESDKVLVFSARGNEGAIGFYIDGSWAEDFDGPADTRTVVDLADIETIEYVPTIPALKYGVKAFNGVIVINTRSGKNKKPFRSQGIHYQPVGLCETARSLKRYL